MTSLSAYLLVSHGSRDSRPQIALERLAYLVQQQLDKLNNDSNSFLSSPPLPKTKLEPISTKTATINNKALSFWVETATLEFAPFPLHKRIQQIAIQVGQLGGNHLKIVPLFLLPGVHVTEDIPEEIAIAQKSLHNSFTLELCPYLGSYPQMRQLLTAQFSQLSTPGRILLSHGSRRPGANQLIEKIASELEARAAYWSVAPSLAEEVEALNDLGVKKIGILPYFIFSGGITDAIAQQVLSLQQSYPNLELKLGNPLGATPELAQLITQSNF